jgi:alkylation response protein AidB-like acyl-CoA dehydrogenase
VDSKQLLARATEIADEVLFAAAADVDRADRIPAGHLDLLAAEGLYAVGAPADLGGLGPDLPFGQFIETLASGCLATAFVWAQHQGLLMEMAMFDRARTAQWMAPMATGEVHAGIALAGVLPGPTRVLARPVDGGYLLNGKAPWASGWGMIDVIGVAAYHEGSVHILMIDAIAGDTLQVQPLDLTAVQASATVNVTFRDHFVPADRLLLKLPYDDYARVTESGQPLTGFLALGLINRCCRLIGPSPFDDELEATRAALFTADETTTADARARASELAVRAAAALAAHTGSRATLRGSVAERTMRETTFLLVFGSRPRIKSALMADLTRSATGL